MKQQGKKATLLASRGTTAFGADQDDAILLPMLFPLSLK